MDFIQEFKKLAVELQKEDVIVYLEQARKMNDMDGELQELIGKFNLTRFNLNSELRKSDKSDEEVEKLNSEVNELYAQIMDNENMQAYNEAKAEVDNLTQYIQAIITATVNGDDPMAVAAPDDGCSGSCSSCSGCH
ncbi:MAG: YlbF family regulator [Oscillospiraceae bacterium]